MAKLRSSEWVGLRRASEMLGVHPATVRNWADSGKLPYRRTAGGHRRFHLKDLHDQVEEGGEVQSRELQMILQGALGQARMEVGGGDMDSVPWYAGLSQDTKQNLSSLGRRVLQSLSRYISAGGPDARLDDAVELGEEYAACLKADGLSLAMTMRGFNYFSSFVVNSILTWSELAPPSNNTEWSTLLRRVNHFTNTIMLSVVENYEAS